MKQKPEHEIGKPLTTYVERVCSAIHFFRPIERKAEMDPGLFA